MTQSSVIQPRPSATRLPFESLRRPKVILGAIAVVACATGGAATLLFQSSATPPQRVVAPVEPHAISAPVLNAPHSSAARTARVADRWYEDAVNAAATKPVLSAAPLRDAWYLDHSGSQPAPVAIAHTARVADRWYEDAANTGATNPVLSAAPSGDASYLDRGGSQPVPVAVAHTARVADRWYEDKTQAAPVNAVRSARPDRDAWYLERRPLQTPPVLSQQVRDTWYRDVLPSAPVSVSPNQQRHLVVDAWYLDSSTDGSGEAVGD
jgi:hypothetical protein